MLHDLSGVEMADFVACLNQKDRLIGVRLWAEVLVPARNAWQEFKWVEPSYRASLKRLSDQITSSRSQLMPVNNPQN